MSSVGPSGPQGCVNLRLDASRRQGCEPRLRSACFNLVAKFVAPFPYVWLCRRYDRKLNASMVHEGPPLPQSGNPASLAPAINPGKYGTRPIEGCTLKRTPTLRRSESRKGTLKHLPKCRCA